MISSAFMSGATAALTFSFGSENAIVGSSMIPTVDIQRGKCNINMKK